MTDKKIVDSATNTKLGFGIAIIIVVCLTGVFGFTQGGDSTPAQSTSQGTW